MQIVKIDDQEHVFDWITHIDNLTDLENSVKNPAQKICIVQLSDYMELWSCSDEFDANYDLERYYKITQGLEPNKIKKYFCKIRLFSSRPTLKKVDSEFADKRHTS